MGVYLVQVRLAVVAAGLCIVLSKRISNLYG
jgi:hypothetical protein